MVAYDNVPGTDSSNNFPPEILTAIFNSQSFLDKLKTYTTTYLGVLANNTDLNTVYSTAQAGTYTLASASTYPNAPVITTGTALLEVVRGGSSTLSIIQRITAGAMSTWREATDASSGTWSAWSQYETVASVDTKIANLGPAWAFTRSVPNNGNLNTYRTPGWSRVRTPDTDTILNLPPGMRSAGMFGNITTGDGTDTILAQVVMENGANARFAWRAVIDTVANTFTPWVFNNQSAREVTEWHVAVVIGQSNGSGRGIVSTSDGGKYVTQRIAQYGAKDRVFETATVPLDMHDTATGLSPATAWAHNYLLNQPDHVGVLLVPAAHGSTMFTNSTGTYTWTPGIATNPAFNLPALAVTQTQEALTDARATGAIAELKAIIFHQGESNGSTSTNTYAGYLDSLISYLRTQFGISNLPFLVGQMVPEGIAANSPGRANIDLAHQQTPTRVPYTGFAPATTGGHNPGDTTHMSQKGVDYIGRTYFEAYGRALLNTGNDQAESIQNGRIAALEAEAGFDGDGLDLADSAFQALIVNNSSLTSGALVSQASTTGKPLNTTIKAIAAAAADGITYEDLGVIPTSSLPPLVIITTTPVASQAAMLALVAQRGDVAIRTDIGKSFILATDSPTTLADWKELLAPGTITSVAGKVGVVTLVKADVGLSNVDNTSDASKPVSTAQATALGLKANTADLRVTYLGNNAMLDTDAPSAYPLGISYMSTTDNGFPVAYATVVTVRTGITSRSVQTVTQSTTGSHYMRAESGGVWGSWYKVASDAIATGSANGLMSAADKAKLDAASSIEANTSLVMRDSSGNSQFGTVVINDTPTSANHGTRKDYVDTQVATRAASSHAHPLSDITVTSLGSGQDLNTYTTSGWWHQALNAQATLPLNYPEAAAGFLEVLASGVFIYQRYWVYAANGADFYWRANYNAGAWTAWQRAANDSPVTGSVNGLMIAADKTKLDTATANATASTLVYRDSNGLFAIATPTSGGHPTTKTYVDNALGSKADTTLATAAINGLMPMADKALIDGATSATTASTLVKRSAGSFIDMLTPTLPAHGTPKSYVDAKTWDGAAITTGTVVAARLPVSTGSVPGTMSAADKTKLDAASVTTANDTLVLRSPNGNIYGSTLHIDGAQSTTATAATRRDYVDGAILATAQGGVAYNSSVTLSAALNTVETMVLEVTSVVMKANRNYRITFTLDVQSTTAASVGVRTELSWGGTGGSPNGTLIKGSTAWSAPVASAMGQETTVVAKYTPVSDTTTRFNVSVIRNSGAADFKIGERMLLIEDMGAAVLP